MQKISVAIPTHNRYELTLECITPAIADERIGQIVLVDDCSTDGSYEKLIQFAKRFPKVSLYQNEKNVDCYANKARAVAYCTNPWVILFDSDNRLSTEYIDKLFSIPAWDTDSSYLPTYAIPHFDYRKLRGKTIDRTNVGGHMQDPMFRCALNTANYFIHRDTYLAAYDHATDPVTADSIYMNYRLLNMGKKLVFVEGLEYFHLVHEGSHYKQNNHRTGNFATTVERKLKALK